MDKPKYYSTAQMLATDKYVKENYDIIRFKVRKGVKAKVKELAEQQGMSVQKFLITLIEKEAEEQQFSLVPDYKPLDDKTTT